MPWKNNRMEVILNHLDDLMRQGIVEQYRSIVETRQSDYL